MANKKAASGSGHEGVSHQSHINKTTLPNGVRVITEVVKEVYSASIGIWIDVGSEDEDEDNNGVSHALEHMLFKGTTTRTAEEIAQQIEDVGGSLGAATGKENTGFYGRVMGSELPTAINLLSDMLRNSILTQDDLDLERQVILEEIMMYEDDPEDLAHEILIENVWRGHPLARPITGTRETVNGFTPRMLREHVDTFYRPQNMLVSIAGNFDEQKAIELIARGLDTQMPGRAKTPVKTPEHNSFVLIKDKDVEQAHLALATKGLTLTDERRFELAVLDLALGGNMSSRLFQEVREKRGLVYSISTFRDSHRNTGLFGVYAAASPKQVEQVMELVMAEFAKVKQEGFSEVEINRAKTQLKAELLLGLESMRNRISRNAYNEFYWSRQFSVEEIVADIDKVESKNLTQLANDLLKTEDLSLVVVGPQSKLRPSYSLVC